MGLLFITDNGKLYISKYITKVDEVDNYFGYKRKSTNKEKH